MPITVTVLISNLYNLNLFVDFVTNASDPLLFYRLMKTYLPSSTRTTTRLFIF